MPDRLTDAHREAMRERRDALFPPPRNPNHVDTIDVARWDAFEHGWNECLAALSREDEGLRVEVVPAGEITKGDDVLITGALGAVRKTVFLTTSSEDRCALVFTDADSFVLPGVDYTVARVVAAAPVASRGIEDACVCGHTARWHSHGGEGGCEHDGECKCRGFTFPAEVHLACGRSFADHSPDGDCPVASREGDGLEGEAREFVVCADCPNPSFALESVACRVCRAGTDAWSEGLRRVRSRESEQGA